jgi:hypothetical protein
MQEIFANENEHWVALAVRFGIGMLEGGVFAGRSRAL